MLKDEMKARMLAAMKARKAVEKGILRVALGEVQTIESRSGEDASEQDVHKILRKLIKSIEESRAAATDAGQQTTLGEEVEILQSLLPRSLSPEEIAAALAPVAEGIRTAGNDGQATGLAMKHLKGSGVAVEGKDVSAAVRALRA